MPRSRTMKAKNRPRPPRSPRPRRRPESPTLPAGAIAADLFRLLWRGALVYSTGNPPFYMPYRVLSGGSQALAAAYDPKQQWVLLDASTPLAMSVILPINSDFPRIGAWPGATAADVAQAIAADNVAIAARVMSAWPK